MQINRRPWPEILALKLPLTNNNTHFSNLPHLLGLLKEKHRWPWIKIQQINSDHKVAAYMLAPITAIKG